MFLRPPIFIQTQEEVIRHHRACYHLVLHGLDGCSVLKFHFATRLDPFSVAPLLPALLLPTTLERGVFGRSLREAVVTTAGWGCNSPKEDGVS